MKSDCVQKITSPQVSYKHRHLLLFNRRRSAEKAVQQAKKQRAVGMER